MIYWPAKSPGETEDFEFDFTNALANGESIASVVVSSTGVTLGVHTNNAAAVTVWISGGALGAPGIIVCVVTTDGGRTYSETAILPIGEEPISLDMVKRQCRAEGSTADDEYFLDLIQAAREYVEAYCGIRIVPAALRMTCETFEALERLSAAPIQSVTSVTYLDVAGVEQTLATSVYEQINAEEDPLRPLIRLKFNQSWPPIRSAIDAVRVSVVAGYTAAPRPVIRAMLALIHQWYDVRLPVQVDARGVPTEIPNTVTALLANYRR